jgi:16S rRNA (cytosine1402-N4)-methyltransferase
MILNRLTKTGRMMVIDKDLAAIEHALVRFQDDDRVVVVHGSFGNIAEHVLDHGFGPLDGIFIDQGISSPQIDEASRGFSFDRDGPLDMRMDQSRGQTTSEWLSSADERDISMIIRKYGEERFSRRIARGIVAAREAGPIETTHQLVKVIVEAIPRREPNKHPATRTFQAIRIHINNELGDLEKCLESSVPLLGEGGRLVVISFHSLEDRIVKRFMRDQARGEKLPDKLPIRDDQIVRHLRIVGKPTRPNADEILRNRRSRSSIMRVAEKIV